MPIEHSIDHERRLVIARGIGTLTDEDVFGYQRGVWSRPDVVGYNELLDMSGVEHVALPSVERVKELAKLSAGMDTPTTSTRCAIVAPSDHLFGLGRMFQSYREMAAGSTKDVGVFRTIEEATDFLRTPARDPKAESGKSG